MALRDDKPSVGTGAPQAGLEAGPSLGVVDLLGAIREEFDRQAADAPSDEELRILARLIAAHLRASHDVWPVVDDPPEEQAIASFVAASLSRWSSGDDDYDDLATCVADDFAQRGLAPPTDLVQDVLFRVALGFLRRRGEPQPPAAQVAVVDWIVTLHRALGDA